MTSNKKWKEAVGAEQCSQFLIFPVTGDKDKDKKCFDWKVFWTIKNKWK